jgi:glycosyltransferase involved in cell wall biosynthesis
MKQLSIIIPAYNMEAYLPQCVESMIRTTSRTALEIVIVNDGSEDRTLRVAQKYAEKYPDTIRVIDKQNGNYGRTYRLQIVVHGNDSRTKCSLAYRNYEVCQECTA